MAQVLATVMRLTDDYTMTMKKIIQSGDEFEKQQKDMAKAAESLKKSMGGLKTNATTSATSIGGLVNKLTGLVSVAYLAKKGLDGMFAAINVSALQKIQENTFQALVGSDQVGSQLYAYTSAYAKASALGQEDVNKGVISFLTVTRDIEQIEQLIKMTERLYAKDPSQGAEGAVFALKEALAGDTISLRNRYGITGLSGESLRGGDTTSKLEQIDSALNQFGATQAVVDKNFNNLLTQTNIFTSNLKTAFGEQAQPVMETLAQTMIRLNEEMQAGKYQPFINLMVTGMELIGNGIAWVADNANWLIPVVAGVATGLVIYAAAQKGVALWTAIAAIATHTATMNWAAAIGVVAGVTAGALALSAAFGEVDKASGKSMASLKSGAGGGLATTKMPVEVTNEDPLKVTGKVDIEQENIKYLMEMAGQKFFAQYSHNTVVPQQQITMNVEKTVDADEVLEIVSTGLSQANETEPNGVYP